jgi:hypothetical protein
LDVLDEGDSSDCAGVRIHYGRRARAIGYQICEPRAAKVRAIKKGCAYRKLKTTVRNRFDSPKGRSLRVDLMCGLFRSLCHEPPHEPARGPRVATRGHAILALRIRNSVTKSAFLAPAYFVTGQ